LRHEQTERQERGRGGESHWANLRGVRIFLRQNQNPDQEIRGEDDSHVIFGELLDYEDLRGLWIELNSHKHQQDATVQRQTLLIPWSEVLTLVLAEKFSPEVWNEAKKIGFTSEAGNGPSQE
jgi:hypothetical protein